MELSLGPTAIPKSLPRAPFRRRTTLKTFCLSALDLNHAAARVVAVGIIQKYQVAVRFAILKATHQPNQWRLQSRNRKPKSAFHMTHPRNLFSHLPYGNTKHDQSAMVTREGFGFDQQPYSSLLN